jgi:hypothetical protein
MDDYQHLRESADAEMALRHQDGDCIADCPMCSGLVKLHPVTGELYQPIGCPGCGAEPPERHWLGCPRRNQ